MATSEAHSDGLLRSADVDALAERDRHLTTTLVLGTLRWQLALDARIQPLVHARAELSPAVATALRMGAYQLLHLDRVPAHAVIHDSVELVKRGQERAAAGLVNAVLRRISTEGRFALAAADAASAEGLSAAWAHPVWMVERWVRRYGLEAAAAICRWDQEAPAPTIRLGAKESVDGVTTEPGTFLAAARRVVRGDLRSAAAPGLAPIRIQDEGSQLVAEIAAAGGSAARRVLDACAAPGGKTMILAERMPEATITAVDVSAKRLEAMELAVRAGGLTVDGQERMRFEVADAAKLDLQPEWDRILCDVPCSGTGTMARNPEIRLRLDVADLGRQHVRQVAILRAALAGLAPGGRLVYSTCSLEPEENENVVEEVLQGVTAARVAPVAGILDELTERGVVTAEGRKRLRPATEGPYLRTVPGVQACDGFFAAVLEKD